MIKLISDLWLKRRDLISDGYDESLNYISKQIPLKIYKIPSGTKCWTWTVPDKWTVKEAYIKDLDGNTIIDLKDHPLHLMSYSLPVDKIVTKEELMKHLHTKPERPDAIPFEFSYYEKKWGFCCQHNRLKSFNKDKYRVFIDSRFEKGELKVGDFTIKGATDETIVLAAHLCHPAMVNDDMAGVAVLVDLAKQLKKRKNYFTYKFMILPETIGSIAYLSQNEKIIPKLKYGIFLEMLGNDNIHALQLTRKGDTKLDEIARYVMRRNSNDFREGAFLDIVTNDEKVFNAPGVDVPMISISRYPYPEYHTSDDAPSIISEKRLIESRDLVLEILKIIDNDYVPKPKFKGPVFLSGYNLWVDWRKDAELNRNVTKIMLNIDGKMSAFDIARDLNIKFETVIDFIKQLAEKGLIGKRG